MFRIQIGPDEGEQILLLGDVAVLAVVGGDVERRERHVVDDDLEGRRGVEQRCLSAAEVRGVAAILGVDCLPLEVTPPPGSPLGAGLDRTLLIDPARTQPGLPVLTSSASSARSGPRGSASSQTSP
jgi:hypothetical protein